MGTDNYKIRISSEADTSGHDRVIAKNRELTKSANEFFDSLKLGVGIDLGGKLVNSAAALPGIFQSALRRGVDFNAALHDSEIAIANVLQKFTGMNREAAKGDAARAIAKIVELEPSTSATLQGLTQGVLATLAAAQSAGIGLEENISLVGKLANALSNAGLPADQLSQELRALFTGNVGPDAALAKTLQISSRDITNAKEAGNLAAFLSDKIGQLGEAGDTFAVRWSSVQSAIDKTTGVLAKPTFDVLFASLKQFSESLDDPKFVEQLRRMGYEIGAVIKTGADLVALAIQLAPALKFAGVAAIGLGGALAGMKIAEIVSGLVLKIGALRTSTAATNAETAAVTANTSAQVANAAARRAGAAGRPAGSIAGGIAGAASLGVGIGLMANAAILGKATEITAAANANRGLGDEASKVAIAAKQQLLAADSEEKKKAAIATIQKSIAELSERKNNADEEGIVILDNYITMMGRLLRDQDKLAGTGAKGGTANTGARHPELVREIEGITETDSSRAFAKMEEHARALRDAFREAANAKDIVIREGFDVAGTASRIDRAALNTDDKARLLELLKGIAEQEREITKAQSEREVLGPKSDDFLKSREGMGDDIAKGIQHAKELAREGIDLYDEVEIQRALLVGDKARAQELERQRTLRQQINALIDTGASQEAIDAAKTTSELQKQIALREEMTNKLQRGADVDLANARATGNKRKIHQAEMSKFAIDQFERAKAGGATDDEALRQAEDMTAAEEKRYRREVLGRIGGPATRSPRDSMGGLGTTPSLDFQSLKPLGEQLPTVPTPAERLGPPAPPAQGAPGGGAGNDLKQAANKQEKAGGDLSSAAQKLEAAATTVSTAASELGTGIEGLGETIEAKFGELASRLQTIETRVDALRT